MLVCPNCTSPMKGYSTVKGLVHACPRCAARATQLETLRQENSPRRVREFAQALFKQLTTEPKKIGVTCPHCGEPMLATHTPGPHPQLRLDVCPRDGYVFFDPKSYQALYPKDELSVPGMTQRHSPSAQETSPIPLEGATSPKPPPVRPTGGWRVPPVHGPQPTVITMGTLAPPAARPIPLDKPQRQADDGATISLAQPESGWQYIPALLGFPIEMDNEQTSHKPMVTYCIAAILAIVYFGLWASGTLPSAIESWGFIPAQWTRHDGLTLFSGFFLHAGLFHLLANLYFLMVFGDNVEDQMGGLWFITLLLVAHLAGNYAHAAFDPQHANFPAIGASGGISGVIAYYAIAFPRAKIGVLPSYIFLFFGMIRMPAIVALFLYIGLQIVGAYMQTHGLSNVSSLAHLGGLAVGATMGIVARVMNPKWQMQRVLA